MRYKRQRPITRHAWSNDCDLCNQYMGDRKLDCKDRMVYNVTNRNDQF